MIYGDIYKKKTYMESDWEFDNEEYNIDQPERGQESTLRLLEYDEQDYDAHIVDLEAVDDDAIV